MMVMARMILILSTIRSSSHLFFFLFHTHPSCNKKKTTTTINNNKDDEKDGIDIDDSTLLRRRCPPPIPHTYIQNYHRSDRTGDSEPSNDDDKLSFSPAVATKKHGRDDDDDDKNKVATRLTAMRCCRNPPSEHMEESPLSIELATAPLLNLDFSIQLPHHIYCFLLFCFLPFTSNIPTHTCTDKHPHVEKRRSRSYALHIIHNS